MRVGLRAAEHFVHPVDQAVGNDVLEQFRLVMDFIPPQPHHLNEEELDEAVPPQDERGKLSPARVKATPQ